jgi:hypothetical protein
MMMRAFVVMVAAFTLVYAALLLQRLEIARTEAANEERDGRG